MPRMDEDSLRKRMPLTDLTRARLMEVVAYDPLSGAFTWAPLLGNSGRRSTGRPAGRISPSNGYHDIGIDGLRYMAHRLAWLYMHGVWPKGDIDHVDGNQLNNKISNLRDVTHAENMQNSKRRADNLSGQTGVELRPNGRFRAAIVLGTFDTMEEARAVYLRAKELFHAGHIA